MLTAAQLKLEMDAKRVLFDATAIAENPEAARVAIWNILEQVETKIEEARASKTESPSSIPFRVDPDMLAHPLADFVRTYLTARGYSLQEDATTGVVTISW